MTIAPTAQGAPSTADKAWNFALVQTAWFCCVLGSATHLVWLGIAGGLVCLALHLLRHGLDTRDRRAFLVATALWVVFETTNRALGVVQPATDPLPAPLAPLWLLPLWWIFATAFRRSLAWMRPWVWLQVVLGAVFGPLGFVGGERLGAVVLGPATDGTPWLGLGVLALEWAVAMPLLFRVQFGPDSTDR